jgi:hypothetical protein
MTDKTRLGFSILGAASAAGALGDGLLRATPWGVNLFVWIVGIFPVAGSHQARSGLLRGRAGVSRNPFMASWEKDESLAFTRA